MLEIDIQDLFHIPLHSLGAAEEICQGPVPLSCHLFGKIYFLIDMDGRISCQLSRKIQYGIHLGITVGVGKN
jgi:hypothetical protein